MTDEALRALERDEATTRSAASAAALARALARAGRSADAYAMACRALRRDAASDVRDLLPAAQRRSEGIAPRGPSLRVRRAPLNGLSGDVFDAGRGLLACATDRALVLVDAISVSIRWRVQGNFRPLFATSEHLVTGSWRETEVELQCR